MDTKNNEKLLKIKNSLEGIVSQDQDEMIKETEKQVLKEQKPKRVLLRANEQIER